MHNYINCLFLKDNSRFQVLSVAIIKTEAGVRSQTFVSILYHWHLEHVYSLYLNITH